MLTSSQSGLVFATAMAVSAGTLLLFDLFREKIVSNDQTQVLKSCLSSSGGKKVRKMKKKRRVQFAEDVKVSEGNGELYRKKHREGKSLDDHEKIASVSSCGNEINNIQKMPANRAALYSGILRDRVHRTGCSY